MARTAIAITVLTPGTAPTVKTSNAIDAANGNLITNWGKQHTEKIFFIVNHTTVSAKNIYVRGGANPLDAVPGAGFRARIGDFTFNMVASTQYVFGPFESARFNQADQNLYIDWDAGTTGTIEVYQIPRTV